MRQFLALELPSHWKTVLDEQARSLSHRIRGWRWLPIGSIHLTLKFLGDVDETRDERARGIWAETVAAHATLDLRLSTLGAFPSRGRPRVLWAGLGSSQPLAALADDLQTAAEGLGFAADGRAFRPHLTLARALHGKRADRPAEATDRPRAAVFRVEQVTLFQSVLHSSGARYTALEHYRLAVGD